MTGGEIDHKISAVTEMSVNYGRWDIVSSASLPAPLITPAALTINNQVYLFGNFSKPERFSLNYSMIDRRNTDTNSNLNQTLKFDYFLFPPYQ